MSKINMKNWINDVLKSDKRLALPIMTHPGIELIREKVINAVTDGYTHFLAIRALNNYFPVSIATTTIMDLTVEAEAFGCKIIYSENELPTIANRLVYDLESVEELKIPDINRGRLQQFIAAAFLSAKNISDKPTFAGCIGPFSLAGRLFDMTEIMTCICMNPEIIEALLSKCVEFLIKYIAEFKKAGAHGIIMAEPAAGLLSYELCNRFSSAYINTIVEEVQSDDFMLILHNCGNTGHVTQSMLDTGARAIHLGNKINIIEALKEIPSDILVLGNLDPVGVFKLSTPEEVETATIQLMELTENYKNFILSSGCDIPPGVPLENIDAFFRALKDKFNAA